MEMEVCPNKSYNPALFPLKISSKISCVSNKTKFMLFEQKSRGKSSVEMEVCPYKCLTTLYFL